MRRCLFLLFFAGYLQLGATVVAQGMLPHPTNGVPFVQNDLPSIHIECGEALEWMYQESNWYSNEEHPATFVFQSEGSTDTVSSIGFRLRGNTSRAADKKSFKISFNTFSGMSACSMFFIVACSALCASSSRSEYRFPARHAAASRSNMRSLCEKASRVGCTIDKAPTNLPWTSSGTLQMVRIPRSRIIFWGFQ